MTRIGRRLIEDFLLPALNDKRYGDRLCWVDKPNFFFSIRWSHKNAAKWTLEDTVVFQDWDKLKGHFHPEIKGYYMQAKQRFRAALYKLNTVRKVRSPEKHIKIYQLVLGNDKKRISDSPVLQTKFGKGGPCIPTSVICRNVNYVPTKQCANEQTKQLVVKNESVEPFVSNFSNDSSSLSNDASDSSSIVEPKHSPNPVPIQPSFTEKMDVTEVRVHPHVPVQPLPEYSRSRSVQYRHISWENVQMSNLQIKNEKDDFAKQYMDEQKELGVLNLSIKQNPYCTTCIPVKAR